MKHNVPLGLVYGRFRLLRAMEEVRKVALFGPWQCWQNNAFTHVERWPNGSTRAYTTSNLRGIVNRPNQIHHLRFRWSSPSPEGKTKILSNSRMTDQEFLILQVWKDYFPAVDAIVFLIDSCDRGRFGESKAELDSLLTDEQLANCPVLVLGNKIDRPGAASEDELRQIFGLYGQTTGKGTVSRSELHGRPLELFMCSVLKRQGYGEGFRWIAQYLD